MIVLLNGSFGIGKTTVARRLVERRPRSLLLDPELLGIGMQRPLRWIAPASVGARDFQNIRLWRRLTILAAAVANGLYETVFVPMAFSDLHILNEVRGGLERRGCDVRHFCLVAPLEAIAARLVERGDRPGTPGGDWALRRAGECCQQHAKPEFSTHISATGTPFAITEDLLARLDETGR